MSFCSCWRFGFRHIMRVEIYSSETGGWIFRQSEWGDSTKVEDHAEYVFFNGTPYAITTALSLITVDTEGKTWRKIRMPHRYMRPRIKADEAFIAHSQGCLYAMHIDYRKDNQLSVWAFEADGNEQWALKHTTSITQLLGRHQSGCNQFYRLVAAHPERNVLFLTGGMRNELMSYDMGNQEVHAICTLRKYFEAPMVPYIPCFAEWPLDGH
uniref:F-box protein At3g26010-like beta-propeller domain-containing protein n=2 Tax=Arundo donax TaxID=35708 RepID=A0A0A9PQR3_ARUDO